MEHILNTKDIRKSYGTVKALKGVSIQVPKGSVYGILGPNGSGKTTMLGILLDVLQADGGQYEWQGYSSPKSARSNIGSLLETPNFYHYLSATDNLKISAAIKGRGENDIERVLKLVNLYNRKDSAFKTFSLGMKQRLAIAAVMLGNPDVLVLDEPTNGLDPVGIAEIRNLILQLSQEGKTIIIASHLLDEVEKVCTHVAIFKLGELIKQGSVLEVLSDEDWIELGCEDNEALLLALQSSGLCKQVRLQRLIIASPNKDVSIEVLSKWCFEHQFILNHLVRRKRSLESKFIEITN